MNSSSAQNIEWEYSPYVGWGVEQESDVCTCESDEAELDAWIKTSNRWFRVWLTLYKIKKRLGL